MKLSSFDIFDTTLIRKCGQPENVFYLLAMRLYPDNRGMREAFLLWRCHAENKAKAKVREVSLDDIYATAENDGFDEYSISELKQAEKQIESEQLTVNPAIKEHITKLRQEGHRIAFISDMYLDSEFLASLLQREGCLKDGERVYVSCECGFRKSTGALYDHVRRELNPTEWVHYGDHPISDVKMARKKGVRAVLVESGYTDTEQRMRAAANLLPNSFEGSILAGLSRYARLAGGNNAYSAMAADFVAPAYAPYLEYIRAHTLARGIKRLYFLSRDSYILQKGMEPYAKEEIELRYLFVSRKALMLPYLNGGDETTYLAVIDKGTLLRKHVDNLLSGLSLTREELTEHGISFSYNKILTQKQQDDFLRKIFHSEFTPVLQTRCETAHQNLLDYFRQEGLLDGTPAAMVDVGWLGTSRLMVNHILRQAGAKEVEFFYYGVRADVLPPVHGCYASFLRPEQSSTELTTLVENYYSASPWPTTVGYHKTADACIEATFPVGKAFKENQISLSNENALVLVMKELLTMPWMTSFALFTWYTSSAQCIRTLNGKIDLKPLLDAGAFDNTDFVRRFNLMELLKHVLTGARITAFDSASLRLTGKFFFPALRWMNHQSAKIRSVCFRLKNKIQYTQS